MKKINILLYTFLLSGLSVCSEDKGVCAADKGGRVSAGANFIRELSKLSREKEEILRNMEAIGEKKKAWHEQLSQDNADDAAEINPFQDDENKYRNLL